MSDITIIIVSSIVSPIIGGIVWYIYQYLSKVIRTSKWTTKVIDTYKSKKANKLTLKKWAPTINKCREICKDNNFFEKEYFGVMLNLLYEGKIDRTLIYKGKNPIFVFLPYFLNNFYDLIAYLEEEEIIKIKKLSDFILRNDPIRLQENHGNIESIITIKGECSIVITTLLEEYKTYINSKIKS